MELEHHRNRVVTAMAMLNVSLAPPSRPVVGRHLSQKEGSSSKMLLSCGNVNNNDDGANDNGRFQMNIPPLINKQHNACFR
jgi:hypothetical protein